MQIDRLSDKGIQKMINHVPAVLQISQCAVKSKQGTDVLLIQVSDGYAKLKKCAIMYEKNDKRAKLKLFDVFRVQQAEVNMKNGNVGHVILSKFTLVRNDINFIIGQPINYQQFKQLKSNPKGDNLLPVKKNDQNKNKNAAYLQSIFEDNQKSKAKSPAKQNIQNVKKAPQNNNNTNTSRPAQLNQQNQQKLPYRNNQNGSSTNLNSNTNKPNPAQNNNNNNNKHSNNFNSRGSQTRHDRDYTIIKQLYQGMQDWKLKVRVIFTNQVKTFIKKSNGQQSQLFNFQACDTSDSIQFTAFGQCAVGFANVIQNDKIYVIANGRVMRDQKANKLKITLNQKSIINLMSDDISLPMVDQRCITSSELLDKQIGTEWNLIALIKDNNQIVQFVSKNGKDCKKKQIFLCDPQKQVQIPLTLWFQKVNCKFQKLPYALQGIQVSQYNGQKQFTAGMKFNYREFKQHQFRKYISNLQKIKFQNPIKQNSAKKTINVQITNFKRLNEQAQLLQGNNTIMIQKVCYITSITTTSKNYYLSCPLCKKKVIDEENGQCSGEKCGKQYAKAKYRYLLNVGVTDQVQMIWATAYDQAAEVILSSKDGQKFTADQYVMRGQQYVKQKVKDILDRQIKLTIVAKKDNYNAQSRIKYSINKAVLDFDYAQENQNMIKKLQFILSIMK